MANHKIDPEILAHQEWIGFVRPTGLVVSAPALVRAGAILDRRDTEGQRLLRACVADRVFDPKVGPEPYLPSFRQFAETVLGWNFSAKGYAGTAECPLSGELEVVLTDYGETLRPDFAVRELDPKESASGWQLLVRVIDHGEGFDQVVRGHGQFEASAHGRMERLLRQTGVSAGLLFNGRTLRVVSAPRGESSGWLDFHVPDMVQTAGRPISTAMRLLLSQTRLLSLPRPQRLAAILEDSRKFQNEVSEKLAEQVLHALYEFLRGFQAAHDASKGELLRKPLSEHPDEVYRALLTVILRLVFLLFAEEKDMLPEDETFLRYYSLAGLYERLREDAALFPDTMDQRYGAWAQILVLFRMIYDGAEFGDTRLPKRHGVLFDPNRFPFLEGRSSSTELQPGERIEPPLVPDGTIYRALEKLLVLDGERISYRALDVEQIGSVYETMMGFRLERATGRSIAVKADKKHGAPTAVNLELLLTEAPAKREKWLQEHADRKISDAVKKSVVAATTLEDLHAALLPVVDLAASPDLVHTGAMVLQPSEERRRSGSHYTPRELTNPIVRTTLEPILARLRGVNGRPPRPEHILDLKVCDPAMGSGAFLVETCRQLGEALVEAWHTHGELPIIPVDEDELVFARRMIAQRCLYGVDKNPVAVDLAKMSLWLVTLAREHALTFLDHTLRCGDSLVGLSRKQIEAFNWTPSSQMTLIEDHVRQTISAVSNYREQILSARDEVPYSLLRQKLDVADEALSLPRQIGDSVIASFFAAENAKGRAATRLELNDQLMHDLKNFGFIQIDGKIDRIVAKLKDGPKGITPFHWELEFPEVFVRDDPGFDAVTGNPPFAGKNTISIASRSGYLNWLKFLHGGPGLDESAANADLVSHFFRRAFSLLRPQGVLGFIATNTAYQGDSRRTGLSWIASNGGTIYAAIRRLRWPGQASVIVCIVHICRTKDWQSKRWLGGKPVQFLAPLLLPIPMSGEPVPLLANSGKAFKGCEIGSLGFLFNATKVQHLRSLKRPDGTPLVKEYIGGKDLNRGPIPRSGRFIIDSDGLDRKDLPQDALALLQSSTLGRLANYDTPSGEGEEWWHFRRPSTEMRRLLTSGDYALAIARVSETFGFTRLDTYFLPNEKVVLFDLPYDAAFCVLQSRCHELWARALSGTMKDDLQYAASDCFETFPFPEGWESSDAIKRAGQEYSQFREKVMLQNNEGLTDTYSRFHDPDERTQDIVKLRELHSEMDHAVLEAYRWTDIPTSCEFILDYEIGEEESGDQRKPWRFRWPDEVRDRVLARLLELNDKCAKEDQLSGIAMKKKENARTPKKETKRKAGMEGLFS